VQERDRSTLNLLNAATGGRCGKWKWLLEAGGKKKRRKILTIKIRAERKDTLGDKGEKKEEGTGGGDRLDTYVAQLSTQASGNLQTLWL